DSGCKYVVMRSGDVFQHQSDRAFYPPDGLHLGCDFRCWGSNGLGDLRRSAKGVIAQARLTADSLFAVHFMYDSIIAVSKTGCHHPAQRLATGVSHFLWA